MSPELRGMWVAKKSLYRKSWLILDLNEVDGVFSIIRKAARNAKERRSVKWFRGRVIGHLNSDYSDSPFLRRMGVKPVKVFAHVTVCHDGKLIVEQMIKVDTGVLFDRDEALMKDGTRIPTPEEIKQGRLEIRRKRPHSEYNDQWRGFQDPGIREIDLMEVRCSF